MAQRKTDCRLPISDNWTFFASSHCWALLSEICWKWNFSGGWSLQAQILVGDVTRNPSRDHQIQEWCSYNFAVGRFHTNKLCRKFLSTEVEFYWQKQQNSHFVTPFGGPKGNVHGLSMAHWKASGRLPISANWTFFASSHGWSAMSRYLSKLWCSKGSGSFVHSLQTGVQPTLDPSAETIERSSALAQGEEGNW